MEELRKIFNRLTLIMEGEAAIRFIDPVVFSICLPLWDTDKDGYITEQEISTIRSFPNTIFENRNDITSLDDLAKLAGYTYLNTFSGMTNLKTAHTGKRYSGNTIITSSVYMGYKDCISLERITIDESIRSIERMCFEGCTSLKTIIWGGNEESIEGLAFAESGLEEVILPDGIKQIGGPYVQYTFSACKQLRYMEIGTKIELIKRGAFQDCSAMQVFVIHAITPPTLEGDSFKNNSCIIYVPDASVTAYKSANNWAAFSTRIKPISEKP